MRFQEKIRSRKNKLGQCLLTRLRVAAAESGYYWNKRKLTRNARCVYLWQYLALKRFQIKS